MHYNHNATGSLFLYKDGKIVQEFNGIQSKPKLLDALKNA